MGAYVVVYCNKNQCKHWENGRCNSHSITLSESGDYEFKCQENTVRY